MKRLLISFAFAMTLAAGALSPLAAAVSCEPGNTPIGDSCCVPVGDGGAISCHDGECWTCIGRCSASQPDQVGDCD